MNFLIKQKTILMIHAGALLWVWSFFSFPSTGWCQKDITEKIKQPIEQSIQIHQKTQKELDQWEQEKTKLISLYEQLQHDHEYLTDEGNTLIAAKIGQEKLNQSFIQQKQEAIRIQKELLPFLKSLYTRLEMLVSTDPPFLTEERAIRLKTLVRVLDDFDISIAEKYRKTMEALFIEAEYGATIEVYQDKIKMNDQEVLGNIFRLGRVSLFFLTLDQQSSAYYNVAQKEWLPLADDYLSSIRSAVDIGNKIRSVELLSLPLGQLKQQGEEK